LRWKRFRRRKKPEPDPNRFRLAQEDIELFQSSPDLEVAYFDESAFSLQGVVPYGWQPEDERYEIPVGPEHGNIQVLGIEEEDGSVYGYLHRGRVVGKTVVEVIEDYSQRIPRNTVLILDRASVHTCELVAEHIETWNDRGLFLYFLPPQSQELNDIERLWKRLKYQELPIDSWESFTSLVTDRETSPRRKRRSRSHSWVSPFSEGIHFLPPA
jgi:transposase